MSFGEGESLYLHNKVDTFSISSWDILLKKFSPFTISESIIGMICPWRTIFYLFSGNTNAHDYNGEGNGIPLQYSCLENPMDGGAWKAAVHGVAEGQTRLSDFSFTFHFHALEKEMATHSTVLAWRIPGMGEPGGLLSMRSHRVGHDWSDLAAAAWLQKLYSYIINLKNISTIFCFMIAVTIEAVISFKGHYKSLHSRENVATQ